MAKRIKIRIFPDGLVQAETQGIKGKACTDYIAILQGILKAEAVDSSYTPEYYERESIESESINERVITSQGDIDSKLN